MESTNNMPSDTEMFAPIDLPRLEAPFEREDWETLRQLAETREAARLRGDQYYRLIGINTIRRIQGTFASVRP
jgi:hypothetical protein